MKRICNLGKKYPDNFYLADKESMLKKVFLLSLFFTSCSKSIFKGRSNSSASSSSTNTLPLNCLGAANSNDVFSATQWDSFLSPANSYLIFTSEQLFDLAGQVKLINKHIELCANLNLQNLYDGGAGNFMLPALDENSSFNGNNFTISNFTFIEPNPIYTSVALFRGANSLDIDLGNFPIDGLNRGEIKNLKIDKMTISANSLYVAGISVAQQKNPITNVHILSGTIENHATTSQDGAVLAGIVGLLDVTSIISPDNILTNNFMFTANSTKNLTLKHSFAGDTTKDNYTGSLIGFLLIGKTNSNISVIIKNNFTDYATESDSYGTGLIGRTTMDLCDADPLVGEKCMDLTLENNYSIATHTIPVHVSSYSQYYYGGMIGLLVPNDLHTLSIINSFASVSIINNSSLTAISDYTLNLIGAIGAQTITPNQNFGITSLDPSITSTYLTAPTENSSYFFDPLNNPLSAWDQSIWSFSLTNYPTL